MKKAISILLVVVFAMALAACGNGGASSAGTPESTAPQSTAPESAAEATGVDTSEFVTIRCLFLGDQQAEAQMVYDHINEGLKEWCNAEIVVEMIPWADWSTRYPLIFSAQEDYDLIPMSPVFNYFDYAPDGVLTEITDKALQTYMPLTWENQDIEQFRLFDVDGKCYMVPVNYPLFTFGYATALRTDLLEKYDMDMPKTWEDLEAFFDAVLENEEGVFPAAMSSSDNGRDPATYLYYEYYSMNEVNGLKDFFVFSYNGEDLGLEDVILTLDDPNYAAAAKKIKSWADKGYWSQNANVSTTSNRDAFESGTSAALFQNLGTTALSSITVNNAGGGMTADIVNLNPQTNRAAGIPDGGMAVPAWSENWERALMVLDYIKFDMDAYQSLRYGLKGTHWEPNEDGTKWVPLDQSGYVFGNGNSWQIKNEFLPYELNRDDQLDSYLKLTDTWYAELLPTPNLFSFTFDITNVSTEIANMNNVVAKYKLLLNFGLVNDVDATIAEYKAALEAAGLDTVRAELETQMTAFLSK